MDDNRIVGFKSNRQQDITGQKFNRLTALYPVILKNRPNKQYWHCKCDCGNEKDVEVYALKYGGTKSCGCLFTELNKEKMTKYNNSQSENNKIPIGTKFGKLTVIEDLGYKPQFPGSTHNRRWYKCLCDCGNICEANGNFLKCGFKKSCGCLISQGEYEIESILKENNIPYIKEKSLDNLTNINGNKLRFDFIIYNKDNSINRCVEFDGRQHFTGPDTRVWGRTTDTLETIQERDTIKNKYCKDNNIVLIRIPYIKLTKITLEDIMGDKFQVKE